MEPKRLRHPIPHYIMKALFALGIVTAGIFLTGCETTAVVDSGPSYRRHGYYDDRPRYGYSEVGYRSVAYRDNDDYYDDRYRTRSNYRTDVRRTNVHERNVYQTNVNRTNVNRTTVNRVNVNRTDVNRENVNRTNVNRGGGGRRDVTYSERSQPVKMKVKNKKSEDERGAEKKKAKLRA